MAFEEKGDLLTPPKRKPIILLISSLSIGRFFPMRIPTGLFSGGKPSMILHSLAQLCTIAPFLAV